MSFCYNQATLVGRLTRDPEYRQISQTLAKTVFTLAISRGFKKDSGSLETDFVPVCLWGRLAELGFQLLRKGVPVLVCGRIQVRNYEKNNEKRWSTEIIVDSFQILGSVKSFKKNQENLKENSHVSLEGSSLETMAGKEPCQIDEGKSKSNKESGNKNRKVKEVVT